jgi:hypothetical protein
MKNGFRVGGRSELLGVISLRRYDAGLFLSQGQERVVLRAAEVALRLLTQEKNNKGENEAQADGESERDDSHGGGIETVEESELRMPSSIAALTAAGFAAIGEACALFAKPVAAKDARFSASCAEPDSRISPRLRPCLLRYPSFCTGTATG